MTRRALPILAFDDLAEGDEWESPGRTITESDVATFAGLSGDYNPLHVDHEFAKRGPFRRPVAHGLLGLSIASGLASNCPRVDTLALLAIDDWSFLRAIGLGETVRLISRVEALVPRSRGRRGEVTWRRTLIDPSGLAYQSGLVRTLVRSRSVSVSDEDLSDNNATDGLH